MTGARFVRNYGYLLPSLAVVLVLGYLLQVFSPLRINTDSYRLLSMALSSLQGHGYLVGGSEDQYAIGYPWLLARLINLHLGTSRFFILLNEACLALGLACVCRMAVRGAWLSRRQILWMVLLTLCSWVMINHVTIPLTDIPFMGVSLSSLYCWNCFWSARRFEKWKFAIPATLLTYAAIQIRSIGITLLPMIAIVILWHPDNQALIVLLRRHRQRVVLLVMAVLLAACLGAFFIARTDWFRLQFRNPQSYYQRFQAILKGDGVVIVVARCFGYRFKEIFSCVANLPVKRLSPPAVITLAVGCLLWLVIYLGVLASCRKQWPCALYFLAYTGLLFIWPYYDERFLIPIMPLIFSYLIVALEWFSTRWKSGRVIERAIGSYFSVFVLTGLLALAYSSRISLSRGEFPEHYGDGTLKMTYRYVFGSSRAVDMEWIDWKIVEILKKVEPLAQAR